MKSSRLRLSLQESLQEWLQSWLHLQRKGVNGSDAPHVIYRFNGFQFDSVRESLQGPDGPIALRDQAGRLLKLLIERAPGIVSKDQILDEVWGHDALSESSIPQAIKDIRLALNDSAKKPEIIITRYGRGYQFVAELETTNEPHRSDESLAGESKAARPRIRFKLWPVLLLVLVLGALALFLPTSFQSPELEPEGAPSQPLVLRAVESGSGESLSEPFVRYLAFVLRQALGNNQVTIADADEPVEASSRLDISLSVRDRPEDGNRFTLALASEADAAVQLQAAQASDLMQVSLDEIFNRFDVGEVAPEVGLTSTSGYATETLLRGMTAQFAGELDRAREMFEVALAEDPAFDFARYELAITLRRLGEYERALAMFMALETRHQSPFWRYRLNNAAGIALWRLGRLDEAEQRLRGALELAESPAMKAILHTNIGLVLRDQQQLERAESEIQLSIEYAVKAERQRLEASARNTLASIFMRTGRPDQALIELNQAERLFQTFGDRAGYAAVLSRSGNVHRRQGELQAALQKTRLAADVRQQLGDGLGVASSLLVLADIERRLGRFEQSRDWIEQALVPIREANELNLLHRAQLRLAQLAVAQQRPDDAVVHAAESLRLAELRDEVDDRLESQLSVLHAGLMQGRSAEQVMAELNALLQTIDPRSEPTLHAQARLFQGRVALSQGDRLTARAAFENALELADELQLRNEQIESLHQLAEFHLETDAVLSAEYLARAEALNPTAYPHLLLQARSLSGQGLHQDALALAFEARETSGDWWQPEDEQWLQQLQSQNIASNQ